MADCSNCKHKSEPLTAEEELRYAHDVTTAFAERTVKRLWVTIILLIAMLVATNGAWLYYDSQYEDVVTETYTATTEDGGNAIANGGGEVTVNGNG